MFLVLSDQWSEMCNESKIREQNNDNSKIRTKHQTLVDVSVIGLEEN